jgi:hypothetical protein
MAVVILLMMAVFSLGGICLLFIFTRDLMRKVARLPYLQRAEGTVSAIKAQESSIQSDSSANTVVYFPVITFEMHGGTQTFTSAFGDGARNRYSIGQKIAVRYDSCGVISPAIDSWTGMWLPPLIGIVSGFTFLGGAAMVYIAFGKRILGW